MTSFVTSTGALVSSAFFKFTRLFCFRGFKTFSDLPDDVLLEVFKYLDFSSIIAMRQTCRRCYRVSKTATLWLDVHRSITGDAEDWRALLADYHRNLSADELEREVTRTVTFERNWSRGPSGARRTASFRPPRGFVSAFIPGGRWFLASTRNGTRGVMSYDFDAPDIQGHLLIRQEHQDQEIWAMDFATDGRLSGPVFTLAVEFITPEHFYGGDSSVPRNLTIWTVTLDESDQLSAQLARSFPVYRMAPHGMPISLNGDSLLRLSFAPSDRPVLTVHRWSGLDDGKITNWILIPKRKEMPSSGVSLLPDGRIVSISHSWVEIYAPADFQWEESRTISQDIPLSCPQWVYEYAPPLHIGRMQHIVSRSMHARMGNWVKFSIHNGETLFSFRIPLSADLEPEVTPRTFGQMDASAKIGLGTSRAILSTVSKNEVTFITLDYLPGMRPLRTFAGVQPGTQSPEKPETAAAAQFLSPYPATSDPWRIDEQSGRILCRLGMQPDQYVVFYFVD